MTVNNWKKEKEKNHWILQQVSPGKTFFRSRGTGHWFSPGTWDDACLWETNHALKLGPPYDFETNKSPISAPIDMTPSTSVFGLPRLRSSALIGKSSAFERMPTSSHLKCGFQGREDLGNGLNPRRPTWSGVSATLAWLAFVFSLWYLI